MKDELGGKKMKDFDIFRAKTAIQQTTTIKIREEKRQKSTSI